MDFGIQMGRRMQGIAYDFLLEQNTHNVVVLSPRNFASRENKDGKDLMIAYAKKIKPHANILIDPQLYCSNKSTIALRAFPHYSVCCGDLWSNTTGVLEELSKLNKDCESELFIIPSTTIYDADQEDFKKINSFAKQARDYANNKKTAMTLSLGENVLKDDTSFDRIVNELEECDADAFYIVSEHPRGDYLVNQPLWLYSYMRLIAGLKRAGKRVYVGYASYQFLLFALAGCDAIFSGNFLNVRRFSIRTFEEKSTEPLRRACWYYVPHALSEFKLSTLDLAYSQNVLSKLKSSFDVEKYTGMLFGGVLPSDTAYNERCSFMHYLICMNKQCSSLPCESYNSTISSLNNLLNTAESFIDGLRHYGIYDRDRNFADALPANLQALNAFDVNYGFQMNLEWRNITSKD